MNWLDAVQPHEGTVELANQAVQLMDIAAAVEEPSQPPSDTGKKVVQAFVQIIDSSISGLAEYYDIPLQPRITSGSSEENIHQLQLPSNESGAESLVITTAAATPSQEKPEDVTGSRSLMPPPQATPANPSSSKNGGGSKLAALIRNDSEALSRLNVPPIHIRQPSLVMSTRPVGALPPMAMPLTAPGQASGMIQARLPPPLSRTMRSQGLIGSTGSGFAHRNVPPAVVVAASARTYDPLTQLTNLARTSASTITTPTAEMTSQSHVVVRTTASSTVTRTSTAQNPPRKF